MSTAPILGSSRLGSCLRSTRPPPPYTDLRQEQGRSLSGIERRLSAASEADVTPPLVFVRHIVPFATQMQCVDTMCPCSMSRRKWQPRPAPAKCRLPTDCALRSVSARMSSDCRETCWQSFAPAPRSDRYSSPASDKEGRARQQSQQTAYQELNYRRACLRPALPPTGALRGKPWNGEQEK